MLGIHQAMQVQQDDEADTTIDRVNRLTTWMHNVDSKMVFLQSVERV